LDRRLSAGQIKWVISRCGVFAGARTHSTIGAISSAVPTLSLAYSRKAWGLNEDLFGTVDYCIGPEEMTPEAITERLARLAAEGDRVRERLSSSLPEIKARAYAAGDHLKESLEATARRG
jgi:polysaccharide pyruvyl transferase WcaK-like protein